MNRAVLGAMVLAALNAVPALAQSSGSDGVYGGYVGSSRQFQMEMESARNRANLQHALERSGGEASGGSGAQVDVHVAFPAEQRGISNITTVTLEPKDEGAHSAMSLAVVDRQKNVVGATFIPKKDVKPGHTYEVVLHDAVGGKYPIGEIKVVKLGQSFELASPLLGQSSSQAKTPEQKPVQQQTSGYAGPKVGAGYTPPQVGSGYVRPQVGPGYVRPQTR